MGVQGQSSAAQRLSIPTRAPIRSHDTSFFLLFFFAVAAKLNVDQPPLSLSRQLIPFCQFSAFFASIETSCCGRPMREASVSLQSKEEERPANLTGEGERERERTVRELSITGDTTKATVED
ncbi:hypothetical protein K504DRAFT_111290 [Pleomassaria siparia CBS 279.74]|uniref:Uncharacterized protein n=1 Tax=Pleomassaria siparia CBS 279.74 TaxID=1314801 RepID=A0A6G1JVY0_9PLEO|nr:hypothetical protein K504DRAFT_111290 [Pleomassaria siparia CBS 279.74]